MADLYIVTVEDDQDGTFWDDPDGYDTLVEAKAAAIRKKPPRGYLAVVYACQVVETYTHDQP